MATAADTEHPAVLDEGTVLDLGVDALADVRERVARHLAQRGVTFGGSPFVVDPVPRALTAPEWSHLEAGLVQRVRALNAFVLDVYGERRILDAGVVPAHVVQSAVHHAPELIGARLGPAPVAVAGLDVLRAPDGEFLVLEDNVRTPSGLAYAMAAREALDAHLPPPPERVPIAGAVELLGAALRAAAPLGREDPAVVVLSDGPSNVAWYEHRTLAERLDVPIVALEDLEARADGTVAARIDGRTRRVDVVYRRTDEDRVTDEAGRVTPVARALLAACHRGTLTCVNAFGTGVADDKLTHAYVEAMVRFYLGEEPRIRSVPTYDLGDERVRERILARIDEVVVKPRAASGGHGVVLGPLATEHERRAVAGAIREAPHEYIAQEMIRFSRHPTVVGDALELRHVDLRAMVFVAGDAVTALPGGLTRVALEEGELVVNSSQDGGGKDTWVLR